MDKYLGCIPNKMRLNAFLDRFEPEVTDLHHDLEMSWNDYMREHEGKADFRTLYDRWFKANKDDIKRIVAQVAKRDYKVEII